MRRSMAVKIFGIALVVLVLMFTIAVLSAHRVQRVNAEVAALAEYYIPLNLIISNIVGDVHEQAIALERALRYYETDNILPQTGEKAREQFERFGRQVGAEVNKGLQLVKKASADVREPASLATLGRLEANLAAIARGHENFHAHCERIFVALKDGKVDLARELESITDQEDDQFDAAVDTMGIELRRFNQAASREAADHASMVMTENSILSVMATALGLFFAALVTKNLVRPVKHLVGATRAVEGGNLDTEVAITTRDEIGALGLSFNRMVEQLRLKERIKDTFGRYIDPRIVAELIADKSEVNTAGEKRLMTIFFSDIEDFTMMSEGLTPDALVRVINAYLTLMSGPIRQHNGIIDKFIGDAIMAFWGPPFTTPQEHARLACFAALEQCARLQELHDMMPTLLGIQRGLPRIHIRIGIATGEVVVGNIGSDLSKNYTVMGDTVNLASRLEGANKQYGTRLMLSETTWEMVRDVLETRELDALQVKGKTTPVRVFELLGRHGELDPALADLRAYFEQGLEAYRAQQWPQALQAFEAALAVNPEDAPSRLFIDRVKHFQASPPGDAWDGVWHLTQK
jgi:class 3 adenylate cyclase